MDIPMDIQEEIAEKTWHGEYFGRHGAIELAYTVLYLVGSEKSNSALFMVASTLYAALTHCAAQLKHFKFKYFFLFIDTLLKLNKMVRYIISKDEICKKLDDPQKEVMIAWLLVLRFISPFSGYRKMAIRFGKGVLWGEDAELPILLFVLARLSRLWFYEAAKTWPDNRGFRGFVSDKINDEEVQKKLGWETINRLARLIKDKELVKLSAEKAQAKDTKIKSGLV